MSKKLTMEEVNEKIHKYNSNIKIIGEYKGYSQPIDCVCERCGNKWSPIANNIIRGENCPKCSSKSRINKLTGTFEHFINQLSQVNPNIEVIGNYKNKKTRVLCRCKVCLYEWDVLPSKLLCGRGCPKCANKHRNDNKRLSNDDFLARLKSISPNIVALDDYINYGTKINVMCHDCLYQWQATPSNLLKGKACPKCSAAKNGKKCRKTHDVFVKELSEINDTIEVIGEYVTNSVKIKCKCKCCGTNFSATPHSLLSRKGCPVCYLSLGELSIRTYLNNHNITFVHQKRFDDLRGNGGKPLSYDFYLPYDNLLIEFQGRQHKEPVEVFGGVKAFKIRQEHDLRKKEYAANNNLNLLEIWYYDYLKISDILSNTLNTN